MGKASDAVAEGLTIADAAARLAIRNHILVATIAQGGAYDPVAEAAFARETLIALAVEQEGAAEHASRLRARAIGRFTDSDSTHDYRDRDRRNLRQRARISTGVAEQLREQAASDEQVNEIVERARADAWGDVSANLERRLRVESMRPEADPEYQRMREARMDAVRLVDLQQLKVRTKKRRKH